MGNDRGNTVAIVLLSLVVLVGLGLSMLLQNGFNHDWRETLKPDGMEPYGLGLFSDLVNETLDDPIQPMKFSLADSLPDESVYLFIGKELYLNGREVDSLFAHVSRGNEAFIAAEQVPDVLLEKWGLSGLIPYCELDTYYLQFRFDNAADPGDNEQFEFTYLNYGVPDYRQWCQTFDYAYSAIDSAADSVEILGWANGEIGFLRIQVGEGNIFLHNNPILFTNLYLKDSSGFEHANRCLSQLEKKRVYWDLYGRYYHDEEDQDLPASSPLKYIFSQPSLRYAWYTLLFTVLLFILFRSKRQQRIVPIIPKIENTSIEFAKALGTLYYQSNQPAYLAEEMMSQFHNHNRRNYGIQQSKDHAAMTDAIALKSKVAREEIEKIFDFERKVRYNDMARMRDLIPLFQALKYYYKNARK